MTDKRFWILTILAVGFTLSTFGCAAWKKSNSQDPDQNSHTVSLVYITDTHAQLEPHPELFWSQGKEELVISGGIARIAGLVKKFRQGNPGKVVFLDAGDTFQGSGPAALSKGASVVSPWNALQFDLAIPGNWEVVYGPEVLKQRASEMNYPIIAANVFDATTHQLIFPAYWVKEIKGVRIGIIGYTDPDVPKRQPPDYSKGLLYAGDEVLQPLVDKLRKEEGVDLVVLLTHIGLHKAVHLAEKISGVDIVLSGDTHERTYTPITRGNTWIVEPGSFGSFLGRLDLTVNKGQIQNRQWQLFELRADRFPEDSEIKKVVDSSLADYRKEMNRGIGYSKFPLYRYEVLETSLDGVLADALREASGTEIALSNGFRFAPPIMPGSVLLSDLWNAYPEATRLKTGKVYGRQIKELWEREIENVFAADPDKRFGGWLPRPSGMSVQFTLKAPEGTRVMEILVGDTPIEDNRIYTITACERSGDPEDTICRIPHVMEPRSLEINSHEAIKGYLSRHNPLIDLKLGRVMANDLPPIVRSQFYYLEGIK